MPKAKTYGALLLHRFGPDLLRDGYKITPDALEEYRLRLHLSTGEVRLIVYLWNKWKLYEEKISLPVKTIADALHISISQVKRYTHALKEKGLLDVIWQPGRGKHNWYDLRPLCEKLRALRRGFAPPRFRGEVTTRPYKNAGIAQPRLSYVKGELWAAMDSISRQFKDTAPKSSLTRAARLWFKLNMPLEAYKDWIQQARQRTKDFWAGVEKPMPYFFGILEKGPHPRSEQSKEELTAPAIVDNVGQDETAFYWDDTPLPAMEQEESNQTVLTPIHGEEMERGQVEDVSPIDEEETLADLAGQVEGDTMLYIKGPGNYDPVYFVADEALLEDVSDLPGALPIDTVDEEIEERAVTAAARYQFGRSTRPALQPLPKGEHVMFQPSKEPRLHQLVANLEYPHLEIIADGSEYEIVLDGLESWQTFLRMGSPAEQRRAEQKLEKVERGVIGRASVGRRAPGRYQLIERIMAEIPDQTSAPVYVGTWKEAG